MININFLESSYRVIIQTCHIFRVAEALILGTMMVGQASAFQPNYNKAVIAAGRIFKLLDRKPQIDSASGDNATGLRLVCKIFISAIDCQKEFDKLHCNIFFLTKTFTCHS